MISRDGHRKDLSGKMYPVTFFVPEGDTPSDKIVDIIRAYRNEGHADPIQVLVTCWIRQQLQWSEGIGYGKHRYPKQNKYAKYTLVSD